jgi:hypothetical protein
MSDSLGLVNPVLSPILDRVARDERFERDHPRRQHDDKSERGRDDHKQAVAPPDKSEETTSMSSTHIDLRA